MFIFNPFVRTFGVTSADYTSFDPSLSYEEISNHVCEEFRSAMRTYCQDNGQEFPMEFNDNINIIILWRNAPDPLSGKVAVNKTLELLCQAPYQGTIYIRSIHDIVAAEGMEHLIHAITTLAENNKNYVFLDNEYFSFKNITGDLDFSNLETEAKQLAMHIATQSAIGKVVSELDRLIFRPEPQLIDRFLEIYWKWQRAEVAVDVCKQDLGVTHRTFYKYSQAYESTLYYGEHLKIFYFQIAEVAKRGPLPEKEEYLRDMDALEQGQITENDVCKKYDLLSVLDIKRVKLALTERRRKAR